MKIGLGFLSVLVVYLFSFSVALADGALLDKPNKVVIQGDYAYVVSSGSNALEVIDISNPGMPAHVGALGGLFFDIYSFDVAGDYAYIGNYFQNTLEIVDVSDPANPTLVNTLNHGDGGMFLARIDNIKVSGNYLFVASRAAQYIEILDISNPVQPIHVRAMQPGPLLQILDIAISGDYLYYATSCLCNGGGSVYIVDVADPSSPTVVSALSDGSGGVDFGQLQSIYVSGSFLYILDENKLKVADVSDPTAPVLVGELSDPSFSFLQDIFVDGNYAYMANISNPETISVVDVSDPGSPVLIGEFEYAGGGLPVSVFASGDYGYIALQQEDALQIMDISNPTNIYPVGKILHGELVGTPVVPPPAARNPVLIVPGVLGTEMFNGSEKLWLDISKNFSDLGDQFMDPMQFDSSLTPIDNTLNIGEVIKKEVLNIPGIAFSVFDHTASIIQELETQSYSLDTDLFLFPYDWRYGVSQNNIDSLKQKILDIKTQTGSDTIDVVAHSTGGLLVKKYVIDNSTNHDIDKAVFVGVPNTGAPKAIKVFLQGDGFGNPFLADSEMKKIATNLPVVYDLAPSREYYNNKGSYVTVIEETPFNFLSNDLSYDGVNSFLENDHNLNVQALSNAEDLHTSSFDNYDIRTAGVDLYNIVGCKVGTIGKVIERRVQSVLGGVNIEYEILSTPGDGTVPLESATNLPVNLANKFYALEGKHATMMTQDGSRQLIVNILSGSNLPTDHITQDISECKLNGEAISVFSPLSLEITDQDGNKSGLDDDGNIFNEIPNADFNVFGEHKFAYLPNDEGQTYTVALKGTGDGTFTIKKSKIVDNQTTQVDAFKDLPVSTDLVGNLDIENSLLVLDNNGDGETDEVITPNEEPLSLEDLLALLKEKVGSLDAKEKLKRNLLKKIEGLEKKIDKKKAKNSKILEKFKNKISTQELKGKITTSDANSIIEILEYLEIQAEEGTIFEADVLQALKTKIQGLTIKQNQKNDLLKRVDRLENKQRITQALTNITLTIVKKNDNGKIEDMEAQALLDLLNQVESVI